MGKPVLCERTCPAHRQPHAARPLAGGSLHRGENGIADAATVDEAVRYSFDLRAPSSAPWRTPTWWVPT